MVRFRLLVAFFVAVVVAGSAWAQSPTAPRAGAAAPAQPASTGVMSGIVQAADTSRPARRARVSLIGGDPRVARTMTTDDKGEFSFTELPGGDFTLSVTKPGWLESAFGQKRAGSGRAGTPIALAAGQHLENITLPLARGGVLTGVVLDEHGDPTFGTPVRAMRYVMRNGERQLASAGSTTTDDRGVYRIPGLLPGEYVVSAVPRETDGAGADEKAQMEQLATARMQASQAAAADMGQAVQDIQKLLESMSAGDNPAKAPTSGYTPVYYPGTTVGASASVINLGISEEKSGIDVQLQVVPLARLTGTVTNPDGSPASGSQIMLLDNGQGLPGAASRTARAGTDGRFTFAGIQQGQYTLFARGGATSPQTLAQFTPQSGPNPELMAMAKAAMAAPVSQAWALADVGADSRSVTPVSMVLQPGMSVSGTLNFEGGPVPADLSKVRVALAPFGQGAASEMASSIRPVGLDADRRFTFTGLMPGKYRVTLASSIGLNGWTMTSAVAAGQDTLDLSLEIKPNESVSGLAVTMSTRTTDLRGTVQGPTGQPAADCTVIVLSSDNRFWTPQSRRIQAARPSTDGRFSFRDLPSGDYRIAAVSDVEPGMWFSADYLRELIGASTLVTLADGERKTQDIKVKQVSDVYPSTPSPARRPGRRGRWRLRRTVCP